MRRADNPGVDARVGSFHCDRITCYYKNYILQYSTLSLNPSISAMNEGQVERLDGIIFIILSSYKLILFIHYNTVQYDTIQVA